MISVAFVVVCSHIISSFPILLLRVLPWCFPRFWDNHGILSSSRCHFLEFRLCWNVRHLLDFISTPTSACLPLMRIWYKIFISRNICRWPIKSNKVDICHLSLNVQLSLHICISGHAHASIDGTSVRIARHDHVYLQDQVSCSRQDHDLWSAFDTLN